MKHSSYKPISPQKSKKLAMQAVWVKESELASDYLRQNQDKICKARKRALETGNFQNV